MQPDELVPYLLMLIPWGVSAREVVRGLRHGEMIEYLRKSSEGDEPGWRWCRKSTEPWGFRFLFGFYALVTAGIPVLLGSVIWVRHIR